MARKKDTNYYFVNGFWVGQDTGKSEGRLDGRPVVRGFQTVQDPPLPPTWTKGQIYEILLEKSPDTDEILSFAVDGQSSSFVAVRELPIVPMTTSRVVSSEFVSIYSGGSSDGKSHYVAPKEAMSCAYPSKPGQVLLPGSGNIAEFSVSADPGRATAVLFKDTPEEIYYKFNTSTGDKMVKQSIQGRAAAYERYVASQ